MRRVSVAAAGAVALATVLTGCSGSSTSTSPTSTSSASDQPAATSSTGKAAQPSSSSSRAPATPAIAYPGKTKDDHLAGSDRMVKLSGWTTTAAPLARVTDAVFSSKLLCSTITLANRDTKPQDYSALSWKLQTPPGDIEDTTISSGSDDLGTGTLAAGGRKSARVCFDDKGAAGQYVLSWQPDIFSSKARGVWLYTPGAAE